MMCGFHKRFPWIIIPRNLCSCTRAIEVLFMKMFNSEGLNCLRRGWLMMNLNLSGWTCNNLVWVKLWLRVLHAERGSLSHGHGNAYVTFCPFGYEVFSEQPNKKKKQNSCLLFLTRKPFKRKSFFKNSFLSDKKIEKQIKAFFSKQSFITILKWRNSSSTSWSERI